jgi:Zn finger protein HypA/HybF involved in hydrogenase expression
MRVGRYLGFGFSAILLVLGLIYLLALASPQTTDTARVGGVAAALLAVGIGLLVLTLKFLPTTKIEHTVVRKIDLSGQVALDEMKCKNCGGALSGDNIQLAADGAAVVSCPYCNTTYQITEAPKW